MANWESKTVRDVITDMQDGKIVLPVIQRNLVWNEDKMELLFDSLFRQNSFGSIICIEEVSDKKPLFAHRLFTRDARTLRDGDYKLSLYPDKLDRTLYFVVDGQQRLQSFYTGLCGKYNDSSLYYDLFSDCKKGEYEFRFAVSEDRLPAKIKNEENEESERQCLWYPASSLFEQLKSMETSRRVANDIAKEKTSLIHTNKDRLKILFMISMREYSEIIA